MVEDNHHLKCRYVLSLLTLEYTYNFCFCPTANLAQIAFESVVSIVNSLHNSQELIRDQQGRNSLLATYLYWVFHLPDPPQDVQNAGRAKYPSDLYYFPPLLSFILSVICLPLPRLISCDTSSRESIQHHGSGHSSLCWQYVTPFQNAE